MISNTLQNRIFSVVKNSKFQLPTRLFATDAAVVAAPKPLASKSNGGMFGGLFQRISSFLVGAGLTALGTHYLIFEELRKSNVQMIEKQKELEGRLLKLEKH